MLPIQRKLTPYNFTKRSSKTNTYLVIHYVGDVSSAKNNALYFYNNDLRGTDREASAHYFVDKTSIWQSVDDSNNSWHCGGGLQGNKGHTFYKKCTNSNSIGIEMCCKKTSSGGWYFEDKTVQNTIELVRYLMKKYNIPIENVIRHFDVTGKICPAPYVDELEWSKFKNRILKGDEKEMTEQERQKFNKMVEIVEGLVLKQEKVYRYTSELPDWARPTIQKLLDKGYYKGSSKDDLKLPETLMRTMVVLDRAGLFDR